MHQTTIKSLIAAHQVPGMHPNIINCMLQHWAWKHQQSSIKQRFSVYNTSIKHHSILSFCMQHPKSWVKVSMRNFHLVYHACIQTLVIVSKDQAFITPFITWLYDTINPSIQALRCYTINLSINPSIQALTYNMIIQAFMTPFITWLNHKSHN